MTKTSMYPVTPTLPACRKHYRRQVDGCPRNQGASTQLERFRSIVLRNKEEPRGIRKGNFRRSQAGSLQRYSHLSLAVAQDRQDRFPAIEDPERCSWAGSGSSGDDP